ncbi:MAG: glutamate--cysteine ligase [Aphanocapsa feldmannii 277cV]|uniref:Glutamate--cysteine ligase n=1 Tax=Aphanocapsa feldmannii 277cV TaxID=2507553 RepID=A0A524RLL6_9CHRO|nr:MAG: glutamate--cysteine ligase [Aphanocapsa feldmannii 277cV]
MNLLLKGFELELFTGRADGTVEGCSVEAAATFADVVTEPDRRNLEYTTAPHPDYSEQLCRLLRPRRRLRSWLQGRGLTLLPGSCLSLGDSSRFDRSDPGNPYHDFIEQAYGSRVVTASVHINFGIPDPELLLAACRLLRCEAALLLALSASSPFLDGAASGFHSQRWQQFPLTPERVPLFENHTHYIRWVEAQLRSGAMRNVRHLWCSVRPNGESRPYGINRIELRICDLVVDPLQLLAITAFAELRLLQLLAAPEQLDPLRVSRLDAQALPALIRRNDRAAARASLDAPLRHWRDGATLIARHWINALREEMAPLAARTGLDRWLAPLDKLLSQGNTAMRWLALHRSGQSVAAIIVDATAAMVRQEEQQSMALCGESGVPFEMIGGLQRLEGRR